MTANIIDNYQENMHYPPISFPLEEKRIELVQHRMSIVLNNWWIESQEIDHSHSQSSIVREKVVCNIDVSLFSERSSESRETSSTLY